MADEIKTKIIEKLIDDVSRLEGRLNLWGVVFAFAAGLALLWLTSSSLTIAVPFVGDSNTGLNIGFGLMLVPLFVLISQTALLHTLLQKLRTLRFLASLSNDLPKGDKIYVKRFIIGISAEEIKYRNFSSYLKLYSNTGRSSIIFVFPILVSFFYLDAYFNKLQVYNSRELIGELISTEDEYYRIRERHWHSWRSAKDIPLREYFMSISAERALPEDSSLVVERADGFMLNSSYHESICAQNWMRNELERRLAPSGQLTEPVAELMEAALSDLEKSMSGQVCAFDSFPEFEMLLNTLVNLLSFLGSIAVAVYSNILMFRMSRGDLMRPETNITTSPAE